MINVFGKYEQLFFIRHRHPFGIKVQRGLYPIECRVCVCVVQWDEILRGCCSGNTDRASYTTRTLCQRIAKYLSEN